MLEQREQDQKTVTPGNALEARLRGWVHKLWHPAGTSLVVLMALLLGWTVVNGKHGLSAWQKQRAEHKQLEQEINELQQDNTKLKDNIQRLKTDPDAIAHEAREQLHYARPGEVIVILPADPKTEGQGSSK